MDITGVSLKDWSEYAQLVYHILNSGKLDNKVYSAKDDEEFRQIIEAGE